MGAPTQESCCNQNNQKRGIVDLEAGSLLGGERGEYASEGQFRPLERGLGGTFRPSKGELEGHDVMQESGFSPPHDQAEKVRRGGHRGTGLNYNKPAQNSQKKKMIYSIVMNSASRNRFGNSPQEIFVRGRGGPLDCRSGLLSGWKGEKKRYR